jgi:hypothetical protein
MATLEGQITNLGAIYRCDVKARRRSTFLIDFSLDGVCCECSCDTLPTLAELVGECMNLDDGVM